MCLTRFTDFPINFIVNFLWISCKILQQFQNYWNTIFTVAWQEKTCSSADNKKLKAWWMKKNLQLMVFLFSIVKFCENFIIFGVTFFSSFYIFYFDLQYFKKKNIVQLLKRASDGTHMMFTKIYAHGITCFKLYFMWQIFKWWFRAQPQHWIITALAFCKISKICARICL